MNKITKKLAVTIVLAAAVLLPCSFAEVTDTTIASVLEKMPAANRQQEQLLLRSLINPGEPVISQICDLIVPPGTGDDTKARYALSSLSFYISRPKNIEMRPVYTGAIAQALRNATDDEVKAFFITQLQLIGTIEYVSDLSGYLDNDRLCEQAAMAMLSISKKHAEGRFMSALGTVSQKNLPTIIHALGNIQSKRAVSEISKHAASDDALIRQVSLKALGNIGDESSIKILEKASKVQAPYEKALATSAYLQLAKRLSQTGETGKSVKICRNLLKTEYPASQSNIPSAALSVLTDALGDKAIDDLLDALDSDSRQLQGAALTLADKIHGTKATAKWTKKLKKVSPARQIMIIEMLGRRNDKTALKALRDVLTDADKQVKLAALKAIVKLDNTAALPDLMNALKTAPDDQIEEFKSILMQLPTKQVIAAIIETLPQIPPKSQVALIEILAVRRAYTSLDMVFSFTADTDSSVNIAATKALAKLATPEDLPRVIDLMLKAETSRQQSEAGKVVIALCMKNNDVQNRAAPLLSALKSADKTRKISIINLLPVIGGKQAFEAILNDTKSTDQEIQNAAIRSLSKWKNAEALDALLEIAETTKETNYHVMTLQGYINLVAKSNASRQGKVADYEKAISVAKRPEEKKRALSKLSLVRTDKALAVVSRFIDDDILGKEATIATMKIVFGAKKDQPLSGTEVIAALRKVVSADNNTDIKNKAKTYLNVLLKEQAKLNQPPEGFVALFNGTDLKGWKGLLAKPNDNPIKRGKLSPEALVAEQARANDLMRKHWKVVDGILQFDGGGFSLATIKNYQDFEMLVDWKIIHPKGDSGIYLRGSPQVQIWDPDQHKIGSGGLYNNRKNPSKPTMIADNPIGQWNTFRIKMIGEKVTVHLNDKLVAGNVTLENYWDRKQPIFPREQIELQCHGDPICFRNIFIREIPRPGEDKPE